MCFFWWLCCSFQVCIDRDVYVEMLPKFQTLISKQQTCFALCEVNFNPMTLVWIFLKSYFNCASFGGGLDHFKFENYSSSIIRHLDNTTFFSFPKRIILKR